MTIDQTGEVELAEPVDREDYGDDDSFTVVFVAIEDDCQSYCTSENVSSIIRIMASNLF